MVEFERNPVVIRQGAAALACVAAAAVAMPAIAERAAEQRSVSMAAMDTVDYARRIEARLVSQGHEAREMALAALRDAGADGVRAQGVVTAPEVLEDRAALVLQASLRGRSGSPFEVPAGVSAQREHRCLSEAIYYEARSESRSGQIAVGEVVMNRVRSRAYPNSICGVVYQGSHRVTGCQFTFTCDGSMDRAPRGRSWRASQALAAQIIAGTFTQQTHQATHYHTTAVSPRWAPRLVETTRIGAHIFYRYPTRAERAAMPEWRRTPASRTVEAQAGVGEDGVAIAAVAEEAVVDAQSTEDGAETVSPQRVEGVARVAGAAVPAGAAAVRASVIAASAEVPGEDAAAPRPATAPAVLTVSGEDAPAAGAIPVGAATP